MSDLADAVSRAVIEHAGIAHATNTSPGVESAPVPATLGEASSAPATPSQPLAQPGAPTEPGDMIRHLTAAESLALIGASAAAEQQAVAMLHGAVTAARAANVSWARIGGELGMSRQAAQQRFGVAADESGSHHPGDQENDSERWLGPVTAFDEMKELDLAGRAGWHTVEAGAFRHRMVRTSTQWQHRRVLWRGPLARDMAEGWQVGCRAFPWIYLVRDTGIPIEASSSSSVE